TIEFSSNKPHPTSTPQLGESTRKVIFNFRHRLAATHITIRGFQTPRNPKQGIPTHIVGVFSEKTPENQGKTAQKILHIFSKIPPSSLGTAL
ncbi:MAG: hypothetical protein Q4P78_08510, partial [Rothia sp. (in: high G+C Gram-positive bacteria)]|uniref:hypothetical protein n=1 Tax=Rothia sp. (in: high G+C Gram-positive bacteria) TaxID=1885016 RepID=UPI0026DEB99D